MLMQSLKYKFSSSTASHPQVALENRSLALRVYHHTDHKDCFFRAFARFLSSGEKCKLASKACMLRVWYYSMLT